MILLFFIIIIIIFFLEGGGVVDKVHYGLCENREFPKQSQSATRHNTQPRAQGYSFLPFFLRKKTLETSLKHSLNMAYI